MSNDRGVEVYTYFDVKKKPEINTDCETQVKHMDPSGP